MKLEEIGGRMSICKLHSLGDIKWNDDFYFIGKTDSELSLICDEKSIPKDCIVHDDGWRALRVAGTLDFSLIGIISRISTSLAYAGIGIVPISTFDTDYILIKEENFQKAKRILDDAGYTIKL